MRYFEEYCEIHLDPTLAPHRWLFRSHEAIHIQFGVALTKQPEQGRLWVELNDGLGYQASTFLAAEETGMLNNGYRFFNVTLPPLSEGGYRYRLGYLDAGGAQHTSSQVRVLFVCDDAPRSMHEVASGFLGIVDGKPLYGPPAQIVMSASPQDWSRRLFYSLVIDRFAPGDHDHRMGLGMTPCNLTTPEAAHSGTLAGVIEKLNYLKTLGVGAILLSPVYVNDPTGYHGYHPLHLLMVEPRLGTLHDLRQLIAHAHTLDIAVILDVVNNHLPDLIDWEQYGGPPGGEFKYVHGHATAVLPYPVEVRNTTLFHGPEYTDMIHQRLFGFLEDWRTEAPYVRELLVQHLKYWLAATNADGFRYDAVRHIGLDFWQPCLAEMDRYAKYLGKQHFLQIAEHAGYTHQDLAPYHKARFTNFLDYPTYFALQRAFAHGTEMKALADYFCGFWAPDQTYAAGWRNNLMFLDNHDRTRILHELAQHHTDRNVARAALHFALACQLLGPQIPALYYGTEQEFCGALGYHQREETGEWIGHDHYLREDMFANPGCVWKYGPINRPVFPPYSTNHVTFQWIAQLAAIRQRYRLFQTGNRIVLGTTTHPTRYVLIHDPGQPQPLLVAMNTTASRVKQQGPIIPVWYGSFSEIEPLSASDGTLVKVVKNEIQVELPPFGFFIGQLFTAIKVNEANNHPVGIERREEALMTR